MTEQPSAEALEIADGQPLAEVLRLCLTLDIDALCAQRVSAETARWQHRDRQRLEQINRLQETVQSLQSASAERSAPERASSVEAYVKGPLPDCMMPDGGEACKAYQLLHAAFAQAETEAFLRGRAVSEKYGHLDLSAPSALASTGEQPETPVRANIAHTAAVADYTERARTPDQQAWGIVHEYGPRWWNEYSRTYPNSKASELTLRDKMAHYCVMAALSAVASERDATLHAAPSPSVVDYTERALQAARDAVESVPGELWIDRRNSETIAQAIAPDFAEFAFVVASEREAAAIRAFGGRVWSDSEETAYQAGVSDTRARLQEPDVELIVAVARMISPQRWNNLNAGEEESEKARARAVLTKIAEMLK